MTENEDLLIRNLLNGVEPAPAARAAGLTEEEGLAAFSEAMKRVAEYRMMHCMSVIGCRDLAQARQARLDVLEVIERIERWDVKGRDLMIAFFKGQKPDYPQAELRTIRDGTLNELPYYLNGPERAVYYRDRLAFIRANRSLVIGLLERFVSFRAPLLYKNPENVGVGPENLPQIAAFIEGQ